jgi:hypothetical protein
MKQRPKNHTKNKWKKKLVQKITNIDHPLANLIKMKIENPKLVKSETIKRRQQQKPRQSRESLETILSTYITTN